MRGTRKTSVVAVMAALGLAVAIATPAGVAASVAGTDASVEVGPYPDFAGDPCSGTTHFTAEWFSPHTL